MVQGEATVWRLFPAQSLKGRAGNYSLQLEARDRGQPPISTSATYLICVQVTYKGLSFFCSEPFVSKKKDGI